MYYKEKSKQNIKAQLMKRILLNTMADEDSKTEIQLR